MRLNWRSGAASLAEGNCDNGQNVVNQCHSAGRQATGTMEAINVDPSQLAPPCICAATRTSSQQLSTRTLSYRMSQDNNVATYPLKLAVSASCRLLSRQSRFTVDSTTYAGRPIGRWLGWNQVCFLSASAPRNRTRARLPDRPDIGGTRPTRN